MQGAGRDAGPFNFIDYVAFAALFFYTFIFLKT